MGLIQSVSPDQSNFKDNYLYDILDTKLLSEMRAHFNEQYYLDNNEDVRKCEVDSFTHYLTLGWAEGRESIPAEQVKSYLPNRGYTRRDGCLFLSMLKNNLDQSFAKKMAMPTSSYQVLVKKIAQDFDFGHYMAQLTFRLPPDIAVDHYLLNGRLLGVSPCSGVQGDIISNRISESLHIIQQNTANRGKGSEQADFSVARLPKGCCDALFVSKASAVAVGWAAHEGELIQVTLNNTLSFVEITDFQIVRCARDDVQHTYPDYSNSQMSGFIIAFNLNGQILADYGAETNLKLVFDNGQHLTIEVANIVQAKARHIDTLLKYWDCQDLAHIEAVTRVLHPILSDIFDVEGSCNVTEHEFGIQHANPAVSIIIPLYGRSDFLQYQISNFSRYQSVSNAEIIYVVDDPAIKKQVLKLAIWAHEIFDICFKVLVLERNVGFGCANNIAVNYCSAKKILLLNSDVLPKDANWLDQMLDHSEKIANLGALGVRLLYEDESIQHDGMAPIQLPGYPGITLNDHPYKGWPVDMSPNTASMEKCNLVTAACMLVEKQRFLEVGGFEPRYFLGDFEDSDLCQKLLAKGYENYIARDIVLYHLERQSQNLVEPGDWKQKLTMVNAAFYQSRLDCGYSVLGGK